MINTRFDIRTALPTDQTRIANLMYFETHVHRHLDWRTPLDWLGAPEYWVLEQQGQIVSALACPPDPETVCWLRLFAVSSGITVGQAWETLWEMAAGALSGRGLTAAVICMHDWLTDPLLASGFLERQKVVMLVQNNAPFEHLEDTHGLAIRPMTREDLPVVAQLDAASFGPLWQNSLPALQYAFSQSGFANVGLLEGEIVAYQMSTRNPFGAHLARLAVHPRYQGYRFGYLMVQSLLHQLSGMGLTRLTVNTQNDNAASLALYQRIGFRRTGEQYRVYTLQL